MAQDVRSPYAIAQEQFDEAADRLELAPAMREFLRTPRRELHFTIPLRLDSGQVQILQAFRIHYNDARGPAKGGIRWHPAETLDTVRALAAWMTWKTSLLDLPLGGGKGGVVCDPKKLSASEQERLARGYIRQAAPLLGVTRDVPAPDVYTNPQIMAWMMDEFETMAGEHHPGVITGKPVELGGSRGRSDSTARGGLICVREATRRLGLDMKELTFAIQGFGNAGQNAALLHRHVLKGGTLVAASDSMAAVTSRRGLDPEELVAHKMRTGSVAQFPGAETIAPEELLLLDVDVLYPSALENVITKNIAAEVRAKIVCELANGPTTPGADRILNERGILVIPDFLANAGGVTVSYFEQVQNIQNYYWKEQQVLDLLDEKMTRAFDETWNAASDAKSHLRLGAYIVAVRRVADAVHLRGWV